MPISSSELKNFKNRYFVETGSAGLGLGIQSALIAGFEKVFSVEINPVAYNECSNIFKDEKRVNLTFGDCKDWLKPTLDTLNEPCTIYLDANGFINETESPLDVALEAIIEHKKEYHTIIIDDVNHGKEPLEKLIPYYKEHKIVETLRQINPEYTFYFMDTHLEDLSHKFMLWVLVADPIKNRFPEMNENEKF